MFWYRCFPPLSICFLCYYELTSKVGNVQKLENNSPWRSSYSNVENNFNFDMAPWRGSFMNYNCIPNFWDYRGIAWEPQTHYWWMFWRCLSPTWTKKTSTTTFEVACSIVARPRRNPSCCIYVFMCSQTFSSRNRWQWLKTTVQFFLSAKCLAATLQVAHWPFWATFQEPQGWLPPEKRFRGLCVRKSWDEHQHPATLLLIRRSMCAMICSLT